MLAAAAWLGLAAPLAAAQDKGALQRNWLRTLPYVRAWAEKYKDQGLVVIGVHTAEFAFEKNLDNVWRAVRDIRVARRRQMSAGRGRRDGGLVPRRGLEDDQRGLQGAQAGHQLGEPGLMVGDDEGGAGGADWDVEMVLGDIETDEELVHDPSL